MADENYLKLLERISRSSGVDKEELERKVEAKRAKLSGLISKEGAAQVVAAELGVSFDSEKLKINELLPGMRKVNLVGKVIQLFPVREFTTKKGDQSKVCNFILADDTSNIKVVLWDTHHIELIEKGQVKQEVVVEIVNASMRENELHLGSFSEFKLSDEVFENVKTEKVVSEKNIVDFKTGDSASVRAFVVQSFDPRFFEVNADTGKKPTEEEIANGTVRLEKRALINIVLDDGTENIRGVLFHETLKDIGINSLEDPNMLAQERENLLGKEMIFSGNVRINKFFNNNELIIDSAKDVNIDELVGKLEAK